MNFLTRSAQNAAAEKPAAHELSTDPNYNSKPSATLEGLIAEDPYIQYSAEDFDESDGVRGENGVVAGPITKDDPPIVQNHSDVTDKEGWIAIPYKGLPDNWNDAPDIRSFHSLDRSFVFPGEQVHILACLSAYKQDTEIITPFKVAAVMNKNGIGQSTKSQNGNIRNEAAAVSGKGDVDPDGHDIDQNGENLLKDKTDTQKEISGESLLRMEEYKRHTEMLLHKFKNSHFFVRISESDEPLWSKRSSSKSSQESSEMGQKLPANDSRSKKTSKNTSFNTVIDRGNFDANVSGGVARNTVKCCSLSNGDIVVLLQVNVGVDLLRDPVLEILQFEKYEDKNTYSQNQDNSLYANQDPCGELLKWLLPLDNTLPPPARPLSPPPSFNSTSGSGSSASLKSTYSASSGSQLFSFGHFRSYSMSSLPQNNAPPPSGTNPSTKPNSDLEDWDRFSSQKLVKNQRTGNEGLLSFRGVPLEPERFSVRCGLEGIYIPGRRWRRKLEIIQPVEIHSFAADCNTDDLLCVQIKNICPARTPDIVIFLDAITIVFEEASKGGPPLFLPIACIEAGNDHSLPNLALRFLIDWLWLRPTYSVITMQFGFAWRGEEHSFILKPATSMWKNSKAQVESNSSSSHIPIGGGAAASLRLPSKISEGKTVSIANQYAVLVSCRCNYTESKLFFKQSTKWRPRISRDLTISVASEMSRQSLGPNERVSQLPVQVLTLQASNLTSEDLTLTVLAPASFTSPPSVVSLSSSPSTSPLSSVPLVSESQRQSVDVRAHSVPFSDQAIPAPDVIPSAGLGCSHLWLQSRVPLGCVPSQSTATIKLELLPLTDGIITLDTLQIDVKEKGLTYIPEHSLMINATSSNSTGIM